MQWSHFFLVVFLIPILIYGKSNEKTYNKIYFEIGSEWQRHTELLEDFQRLDASNEEARLHVLHEAIECCRRAIHHCDVILKHIADKPKSKQKKQWRVNMKKGCERGKIDYYAEIDRIQAAMNQIGTNVAIKKAQIIYQESEQKIVLAKAKSQECPRRLNNVDAVVSNLHEVSSLCEEASSIASEALALFIPYATPGAEESKVTLQKVIQAYQEMAEKYKKEAEEWPASVIAQKTALKERIETLREDSQLFEEKGLQRSSYELQKQAVPILEQLIESSQNDEEASLKNELVQIKNSIALFEKKADSNRLIESTPISAKEFKAREDKRRDLFFKNNVKPNIPPSLQNKPRPFAIPLDGQTGKNEEFILYTEQFYRFLVQSDTPISHLVVKVSKKGEVLYEEKITLPLKNTIGWEQYLTTDGLLFIPETKLKALFGIDLRLNFVCNPHCNFSLIIAQKSSHSNYQLSFFLDEATPLYTCNLSEPPPWQLGALLKPALPNADKPIKKPCLL